MSDEEIHDAASPSLDLTLPELECFCSEPPLVSLTRMIWRSQQLRRWFLSGLRSANVQLLRLRDVLPRMT